MIKLRHLTLREGSPHIAVVVTDQDSNADLMAQGIDVLEIRVDLFQNLDSDHVKANITQRAETRIPLILTVRNDPAEGAQANNSISDDLKFQIFQDVIALVDAIDIELSSPLLSSISNLARQHQKVVIVSSHNFKTTPEIKVLEGILENARSTADIIKIAAQANSMDDVGTLTAFTLKHKNENIITMAIGALGMISRLMFPLMGSLLTYSYIGKPSAPGQIPLKTLQDHLKIYC